MGFEFEEPLRLLLLVPALGLIFLFLRTKMQLGKSARRVIVSLRSAIVLLLVFALAMPNLVFTSGNVPVVFVVDLSDSAAEARGEMTAFIREAVASKGADDRFAIVTVGRDGSLERLLGSEASFRSDWSSVAGDFTNLEAGLQLASSILAQDGGGRIVVLSDGNETIGDGMQQAAIVQEQGIVIDAVPVFLEREKDVALEDFVVPRQLYKGEQASLALTIHSTEATESMVRILVNNERVVQESVPLRVGANTFRFTYPVTESGMHRFRAEVVTDGDSISENNQLSALSMVAGTPQVLLVEGGIGKAEPLYEALTATELNVSRITPEFLPSELNGYLQYDSIIFANVPSFNLPDGKLELIEKAVRDFGVGFIMTGGHESFALGGYKDTAVERLLPVEMEIKNEEEIPSLGLVFVIDRSGSMMGMRLELAKEAAARSVELLRVGDTVGVIAFDTETWQIVETEEMTDVKSVTDRILGITVGGGTDIYPGLALAYRQLAPLDLQRKHIILLTDGESPETGNYQLLIEGGREEDNITLSTVAIGDGADHYLLDTLAEYGTGRFYAVYDESTIPSILSRETMLTTRTYIEDEPFYPVVMGGGAASDWTERFAGGVPQLNAYVATTEKGRATVVLQSEKEDPVLARWQYGLGKTVAWTSDVEGAWSGPWAAWDGWSPVWNDIVTWTLPSNVQEPFDVTQRRDGTRSILTFTSEENQGRPLTATVVGETGQAVDSVVRMTAPGQYEVSFEGVEGMHYVQLTDLEGGAVFQTGVTVAYPDEYRIQPTNVGFLKRLAEVGGGEVLAGIGRAVTEEGAMDEGAGARLGGDSVFRALKQRPVTKQSIAQPMILLAFLLFFVEVALRRFGVPRVGGLLRFWKNKDADVDGGNVSRRASSVPKVKRVKGRRGGVGGEEAGGSPRANAAENAPSKDTSLKEEIEVKSPNDGIASTNGKKESKKDVPSTEGKALSQTGGSRSTMKRLLDAKKRV